MILFSILFTYILIEGFIVLFHVFSKYAQNNLECLIQKMIHQIIQILHSMLQLEFQIYCCYMTFLYFSVYSISKDLIKQLIYHFFLSLFYLQDGAIVYEDQMFYQF